MFSGETKAVLSTDDTLSSLSGSSCICYTCFKRCERNKTNVLKRCTTKPNKRCDIESCKNPWHSNSHLTTACDIEHILEERVRGVQVDEDNSVISLCREHYNTLYTALKGTPVCSCCGIKQNRSKFINRRCPEPDTINPYLQEISDGHHNLTSDDYICFACYKYFRAILTKLEQGQARPVLNGIDQPSLAKVKSCIATQITTIGQQNVNLADYLELNAWFTAQHIADYLGNDQVMLFPDIYNDFKERVTTKSLTYTSIANVQNKDIPSKRWLLARLHNFFESKLIVECRHRRHGSLVYLEGCDHLTAISSLLAKLKTNPSTKNTEMCDSTLKTPEDDLAQSTTRIDDCLHKQARKLVAAFRDNPNKFLTFNIETFEEELDPLLIKFVRALTESVRGKKHSLFLDESTTKKTKNIRQLYVLSVLLYITDTTCSMPLHTLIAEAVLCHSGSHELVRILNRVGACASLETAKRLSTLVVHNLIGRGILPELVQNTLTVVSIDNIDTLQPHSMVSTTDATRSWHGTSVQCMQPMPNTLRDDSSTDASSQSTIACRRKHPLSSPVASPIAVAKSKRRCRTLTEQQSPHSHIVIPRVNRAGEDTELDQIDPRNYPSLAGTPIPLERFTIHPTEKSSLHRFKEIMFQAVLLKHCEASGRVTVLPGLVSLLSALQPGPREKEESNVVYVDIRSERADCKETLGKVLANLYRTFIVEYNQKWLIVVEDAKTFDLLHAIRAEYGSHLKWLLPFPGDWHILFNYQKVIMKIYADAGLQQLGKVSGHRAETLTSLIQCTNFRRTHNFISQVVLAFYQFFFTLYMSKSNIAQVSGQITSILTTIIDSFASLTNDSQMYDFSISAIDKFEEVPFSHDDFQKFMSDMCKKQDTIRFWYQFAFEDCLAYLGLYTSIRTRNWHLRTSSIKLMAPIFEAFDRQIYQRLIPQHLMDLAKLPHALLQHLQDGGFSVRLSPSERHGVALDECHEMKINKDSKMAVIRPSVEKMEHITHYLQFRAGCINNLQEQCFPERKKS